MLFFHVADLHIGKKLCDMSLLSDQEYALDFIAKEAEKRRPDAVFIAGDVYDRPVPGADAVMLLDKFLNRLLKTGAKVFIIGGNHDSQERLAFGREPLMKQGLVISAPYAGTVEKYDINGVKIWLLPHIRPREAEMFFDGKRFETVHDAVEAVLAREELDESAQNIILCHQFVTSRGQSAQRSESEVDPIGGESGVDASLFDKFDYAALGHLHAAQQAGRPEVRYSGSPVKYSFSEARHKKSFVVGNTDGMQTELVDIPQLHGMRELRGPLNDILAAAEESDDYIKVTLTDDVPPASPMERLNVYYKNVLRLELELKGAPHTEAADVRARQPMELFADFYKQMTGTDITEDMLDMAKDAFEAVREDGV